MMNDTLDRQNSFLRACAMLSLLYLHLALSFTWIPNLYGIWPIAVTEPSIILTGFASFLNLFGLLLFFIISGYSIRKKALTHERYLLQKVQQNSSRFLMYYLLLSLVFYLLLSVSKWRFLAFNECTFLASFYHLWFLAALAFFQLLLAFARQFYKSRIENLRIPLVIPLTIHAVGLFLQGGVFLKTPTQLDSSTLLSIGVYFFWFLYGFTLSQGPFRLSKPFSLARLFLGVALVGLYFLAKTALIFSWHFGFFWKLLSSVLDPLTFLAALQFCFWLFEKFAKRQHRRPAKQLQTFMQRYQLPIYVFQIPLIFVLISIFEQFGAPFFTTDQKLNTTPDWEESLYTWGLLHLLLFVFSAGLVLLWCYHQQKTPHSKE
jgi:hypothetical protein